MKIAVIGSGVYALALINGMSKNNHSVNVWTHDEAIVKKFNLDKVIENNLGKETPLNIKMVSTSMNEVCNDVDLVYIVVTSEHFNSVINKLHDSNIDKPICIATKGLDTVKNDFLSNTTLEYYNKDNIAILSGPCFATDLLNDELIALSIGVMNDDMFDIVSKSIESEYIALEKINGFITMQLCNSVKNITAIASGMLAGFGYSNSTNAFLMTKVIKDIRKIVTLFYEEDDYVISYAGIGDTILTCTSSKSRNFKFGYDLANNLVDENYLKTHTVEGYTALKTIKELFIKYNISFPFIDSMYKIIYEKEDEKLLIKLLKEK